MCKHCAYHSKLGKIDTSRSMTKTQAPSFLSVAWHQSVARNPSYKTFLVAAAPVQPEAPHACPVQPATATTRLVKPALLGLSIKPAPEKLSCDVLTF